MSGTQLRRVLLLAMVITMTGGVGAYAAFFPLPSATVQVNDDGPTIDKAQDAGLSDVVGGTLTAGGIPIPWACVRAEEWGCAGDLRARVQGGSVEDGGPRRRLPAVAEPRRDAGR
jgi:hypothetical protein